MKQARAYTPRSTKDFCSEKEEEVACAPEAKHHGQCNDMRHPAQATQPYLLTCFEQHNNTNAPMWPFGAWLIVVAVVVGETSARISSAAYDDDDGDHADDAVGEGCGAGDGFGAAFVRVGCITNLDV
ncbi:unnamed protein product [Ceratitis capitata]|uniref:(Mediterranean fruit fly) hypothetical protein n=1 Tax=Ceratitis capitata TaxID=7213 RepID=A0A811UZ83_CERCA|nr:unnamed protein product [Ceratitis capitata]